MKQIKIHNEVYSLSDDVSDGEIKLMVGEVLLFKKYKGYNLIDVFESIDLSPEMIGLDGNEIYESLDSEYVGDDGEPLTYEEFLEAELRDTSLNFLEEILIQANKSRDSLGDSENRVIEGEVSMYMLVRFYTIDEYDEYDDEIIENIKMIKSIVNDEESLRYLDLIDLENTYEGVFYVMQLSTYY
ncbi:hypothetical protein Flavo103_10950 [Flavobacterium collinsii]|uniref:hypothetical protein n=1 Tax=Flavobacterium TaxID=237 RepID=UPI001424960F|nr:MULTISPECIES: hypothetical protein [Flavobacterium]GIQ57959.1 hypothetical protein Flavo103_10950 [Flavobacterium collinsii]